MAELEGKVESISDAGSLITDITETRLADVPRGEEVIITCSGHETNGILPADHNEPENTLLAMIGASGNLEIEIVGTSISEMLRIPVGERVTVKW